MRATPTNDYSSVLKAVALPAKLRSSADYEQLIKGVSMPALSRLELSFTEAGLSEVHSIICTRLPSIIELKNPIFLGECLGLVKDGRLSAIDYATLVRLANVAAYLDNDSDVEYTRAVDPSGGITPELFNILPRQLSHWLGSEVLPLSTLATSVPFTQHFMTLTATGERNASALWNKVADAFRDTYGLDRLSLIPVGVLQANLESVPGHEVILVPRLALDTCKDLREMGLEGKRPLMISIEHPGSFAIHATDLTSFETTEHDVEHALLCVAFPQAHRFRCLRLANELESVIEIVKRSAPILFTSNAVTVSASSATDTNFSLYKLHSLIESLHDANVVSPDQALQSLFGFAALKLDPKNPANFIATYSGRIRIACALAGQLDSFHAAGFDLGKILQPSYVGAVKLESVFNQVRSQMGSATLQLEL